MSAQPKAVPALSTDAELIARVRAGDRAAIETLVRRYNRVLYRTARAILRDDTEAEDVVQETYIGALRGLESFRGDSSLGTWLVRIAANEALMRRRRLARQSQVIPMDSEGQEMLEETVADLHAGPEREAMNSEMRRALESGIDALPDLYRTVFVLRAVEELTVEETAAALDLPEATVRTRFFRARGLLRGGLEKHLDRALGEAFAFDGERCDRIVARVLGALARE